VKSFGEDVGRCMSCFGMVDDDSCDFMQPVRVWRGLLGAPVAFNAWGRGSGMGRVLVISSGRCLRW
jgi:hypothetical protein